MVIWVHFCLDAPTCPVPRGFFKGNQIRAVVSKKLTQGPILMDQAGCDVPTVVGRERSGLYRKCLGEESVGQRHQT